MYLSLSPNQSWERAPEKGGHLKGLCPSRGFHSPHLSSPPQPQGAPGLPHSLGPRPRDPPAPPGSFWVQEQDPVWHRHSLWSWVQIPETLGRVPGLPPLGPAATGISGKEEEGLLKLSLPRGVGGTGHPSCLLLWGPLRALPGGLAVLPLWLHTLRQHVLGCTPPSRMPHARHCTHMSCRALCPTPPRPGAHPGQARLWP